ncbi:HdeD family acid-resistance protein [Frischella perrara]|uniref:HdeD family acid-resistance protein n=1 Tax=Frischella perrara TaxID=1267021 RepID=UPI0023F55C44|nr:HdeD family acid-resistance protein [Frischella perrara]
MTRSTQNLTNISLQLKSNWGWFIAIGILLIIFGIFALTYQFFATVFSIYFIGFLLVIAGLALSVHSFRIKGFGQTTLWAIMGVLYIIAGIATFIQPILASTAITLVIAFLFTANGVIQIIGAFTNRHLPYWGWWLFSGIMTLLLGVIILFGWPGNSLWILGMFLGIDLVFQGWTYVVLGIGLKTNRD